VARDLGIDRRSVGKMLKNPVPPGYRLQGPRSRPVLGPFEEKIREYVEADEKEPLGQRRTAKKIFETLRDEHGYPGGHTQVQMFVAELKKKPKEAFVPLVSVPGEAEADFNEEFVEIAGRRVKAHSFLMVLPYSGVWFKVCYPAENAESFADGHARAFRFFGGAVVRCVYDNAGYSVKRGSGPMKGRDRELTDSFATLQSVFLFRAEFAAPAKGNEKGSVERAIGALKRSLMSPVPKADSFEELNEMLMQKALANKAAHAEKFAEDTARLLPLPDYEPCRLEERLVDKLSLVRFETCSYSVPTDLVGRSLKVRATPFKLEILDLNRIVASHERCYEKGRIKTNLLHYLNLLERKPRAVNSALPVVQAGLPMSFEAFRKRVVDGTAEGDKRFVGVLVLLKDHSVNQVADALEIANARGICEAAAIRCLLMRGTEEPAASLCMEWKLPDGRQAPTVEHPPLRQYDALLEAVL
jgi:transposase